MNRLILPALSLLLFASSAGLSSAAAVLANTGFEDPVTSDGAPFVGFWEIFNSGGAATSTNSTLSARTGSQSLQLSILATDNAFAGAFQDVPDVAAGMQVTFGGYHRTSSSPLDLDTEIRIEWRNSVSNTEIGRTPNSAPVPGAAYGLFSLTGTVPAGANTARVVYAIQTFSGGPTNNGVVYVDDVFFTVPEPGSALLLGLSGLALARRQRRN